MLLPVPIQRPQGCLRVPPEWGIEALTTLAKAAGATHTHRFYGPDQTEWFEWYQHPPLPEDAPRGVYCQRNPSPPSPPHAPALD